MVVLPRAMRADELQSLAYLFSRNNERPTAAPYFHHRFYRRAPRRPLWRAYDVA